MPDSTGYDAGEQSSDFLDRSITCVDCGEPIAPAAVTHSPRAWVDFHNVDSEIWRRMGESAASAYRRIRRIFTG